MRSSWKFFLQIKIMTFLWPSTKLIGYSFKSNHWLFLVLKLRIFRSKIKNNFRYNNLLRPDKQIDDNITLRFVEGSEVFSFQLMITVDWKTQFNSSIEQMNLTKGQIISKCLFGVFNFFQKKKKNMLHGSKNEFICSFFGRIHFLTICL